MFLTDQTHSIQPGSGMRRYKPPWARPGDGERKTGTEYMIGNCSILNRSRLAAQPLERWGGELSGGLLQTKLINDNLNKYERI